MLELGAFLKVGACSFCNPRKTKFTGREPCRPLSPRRKPAPVWGSTGRGSALCRGALSLITLSFTQENSRAHPLGRERFSRARIPSDTSERRIEIAIFDWYCFGPFRSLCLLWRRGCGPPPVSPDFLTVTLVRAAYWSDAENRTSLQTTNANRTTDISVARWRR